jgi:outer membrane lipoprotein-sorting protein
VVTSTISLFLCEGMFMNKLLVAGILGLMLTACGQKEEQVAEPAAPAAEAAAAVEKAATDVSATVEKAATDTAEKVEAAVSGAKAQ